MSLSHLTKLMFTVGVRDQASQPLKSLDRTLMGMKQHAMSGFDAIRGGAFGLAGAGLAIKTFMQPVYDFDQAIGQVKSLGVLESEIQKLTQASLQFSMQYGTSAAEVVRSSYDIQSAIAGLKQGELAQFTVASNMLAQATKADAATITNYMGTLYGIFKDQADAMGRAHWVHQMTGLTAQAVQMFKTDGMQMSGAFTSIGANATASGVSIQEQMAILGNLQATMSGSEAGTKYKAFLAGVASAQEKLNLSLTDSQGRLLPMVSILEKIRQKFGSTLSEMEGLQLKQAFGSDEAVSLVKLLMGQTQSLSEHIEALGKIKGMDNAIKMAQAMTDPWKKFHAATEAVRISFGTALMPTINHLLEMFGNGLQSLTQYTQTFPNITRSVGLLTLSVLGLSAVTGLCSILFGLARTALAALNGVLLISKALWLGAAGLMGLLGFRAGFCARMMRFLRASVLWVNLAMSLNPMGLMIGSMLVLIGLVGSLCGVWNRLTNLFANTQFGQALIEWFEKLFGYLKQLSSWLGLGDWAIKLDSTETQSLEQLQKIMLGQTDAFDDQNGLMSQRDHGMPSQRLEAISSDFVHHSSEQIQSVFSSLQQETRVLNANQALKMDAVQSPNWQGILKGSNASSPVNQFGDVYIEAPNGMTPDQLEQWQMLQAG